MESRRKLVEDMVRRSEEEEEDDGDDEDKQSQDSEEGESSDVNKVVEDIKERHDKGDGQKQGGETLEKVVGELTL
ncbi:hypothetical protein IFR05_014405 [Cadophora sp. M221]|nr:hypothetical protein IFR05_014405 [Cadophora sp. M221]